MSFGSSVLGTVVLCIITGHLCQASNRTIRAANCNIERDSRIDCYPEPGSSHAGCTTRGCCWKRPSDGASNIPWCFKPSGGGTGVTNTGGGVVTTKPLVTNPKCSASADDASKTDCNPGLGVTSASCIAKNCCWEESGTPGTPWCFYPVKAVTGYQVDSISADGGTVTLSLNDTTHWPNDVKNLKLEIYNETNNRLHFKIIDPANKRYEVPLRPVQPAASNDATDPTYGVSIQQTKFGITVTRKSTGAKLFDTTKSPLIYADQFLQITTALPTSYIYGLGEHRGPFWLDPKKRPMLGMWARDIAPSEGNNLYGSHPFFLGIEDDGNAFGVFLLNSNGMQVDVLNTSPPSLRYRVIGGILDFYVFTGPDANDVIQQYTDVIGKPMLPPYWSLGYHNCRWGWGGNAGLKAVIKRLRDNGVPFDTTWADIDYMRDHLDFTVGNDFSELPEIVKDLHAHGQKFVPIVDPAIGNQQGYQTYDDGIADDIFIKTHDDKVLIGKVWPGNTAFPDFTHPKALKWWEKQHRDFHAKVQFDGIWIDMNEPANFGFGSNGGCSKSKLDNPPFTPAIAGRNVNDKTVCSSAKQHLSSHYNLHNMYGHFEGIQTNKALTNLLKKRPFVLSRSTFPGSGQYVSHWEGDNNADWHNLQVTIAEILNFNMFGIPFVGCDICGFQGRTTDELCTRWMQLGTFYPFMRNHRDIRGPHQDPMSPEFSSTTHANLKKTLLLRYRLLPFLYTSFYHSHMTGQGIARPLFFKYPTDKNTLPIDNQMMWTDALLISPVIHQGKTTVSAYFPKDRWFDFYNGKEVTGVGSRVTLQAPIDMINVHIRGGSIIPTQEPDVTTVRSRLKDFGLTIAVSSSNTAKGSLFWDDGDNLASISGNLYNFIEFELSGSKLTFKVIKSGYATKMNLGHIEVYGLASGPTRVLLDGTGTQHSFTNGVLKLERLTVDLTKPHSITWS